MEDPGRITSLKPGNPGRRPLQTVTVAPRERAWSEATVLTLLGRLEAKAYVTRDESALAHEFRPAVSRDTLLSRRLSELAEELCDGTTAPLVLASVRGRKPSADEVRRVRQLLDALEAQEVTRTRTRRRRRKKRS